MCFSESACLHAGIRQHAEVIRKRQFGARASISVQTFLQQAKPLLQPALQKQAASGVERTRRVPEKKTLLRRNPHFLFAGRMRLDSESTMMVEPTGVM